MQRWVLSLVLASATLASAGLAQTIPASGTTVRSEITPGNGSQPEHVVYVINNSSETVIVTSIRLIECQNVQGGCSTRRMKTRVPAGSRILVHRVRARDPQQGFGFRLTFTWEKEAEAGVSAKDVEKDENAFEIGSVEVKPKVIDLQVGETIDLSQVLAISARNLAGKAIQRVFFSATVTVGEDNVALEGSRLVGKAAGTAGLSITVSAVATPNPSPNPKATAEVIVTVVP